MYKIAHISDTHIKNLKYHYEYKIIFDKLYESLKSEKVDYIIHCGDLAHTKTQISPEFVELCSDFLRNLADIAPTYVILGNHDGNLRNSQRQDAITPIVNALDHDNLFLLKNSQELHLGKTPGSICLNVLSVFDEDNWVKPTDQSKINIALYHGAVKYSRTDLNFSLEHGDHDVSIFRDFDFAFLGDIHKTQFLDTAGRIAYAGSTIQQNFGETDDKGYLLWKIHDKDTFQCEKIIIKNPKPFVTIGLTKTGRLPNKLKCPESARIRLVTETNLPLEKLRKAVEVAKARFKPETITYLNRAGTNDLSVEGKVTSELFDNLRDEKTQQKLIKEYLKDFNPDEETLKEVYKLNSKYNKVAESELNHARNVHWKIKSLKWSNLFNYGEDNFIDFQKLSGTVGIFGKNFSGKSSIIDSLLYTIYNTTSKNIRKNYNIINQNKASAYGEVEIEIGDKIYTIRRESEKYVKKLKGKETNEARTQVDFYCKDLVSGTVTSLNQTERGATDKAIRSILGDFEDFVYTTMSTQLDSLSFINEGSTKRKETLAKFLDLEFFEKKFKLAKEDASELRGSLKRVREQDYSARIEEQKKSEFDLGADLIKSKKCVAELEALSLRLEQDIADLSQKLLAVSQKTINKKQLDEDVRRAKSSIEEGEKELEQIDQSLEDLAMFIKSSKELLDSMSLADLENRQSQIDKIKEKIREAELKKKDLSREAKLRKDRASILENVPCGDQYLSACKFIKEAAVARDTIQLAEKAVVDMASLISDQEASVLKLSPDQTREMLSNWYKLSKKTEQKELELVRLQSKRQATSIDLERSRMELEKFHESLKYYEENREVIEDCKLATDRLAELTNEKNKTDKSLEKEKESMYSLVGRLGAIEEKIRALEELKEEREQLEKEYSAYHLFMTCMHSNGIAFDIIKKALPVLNSEISKVLANVVEFDILFENAENKLDILIKHPKHDARPLENGSGAEKALAAIAIRIALLNISNMPKSSVLILDEPGTALDPDNMEGFIRILDLTKGYFNITLLITHVETLKDIVDMTIDIMKVDEGYAHVNQ